MADRRAKALVDILRRIVFPPAPVAALALPAIALMMAWVFLLGNEGSPLAYAAYAVSAYLLIVACVFAVRHFPKESIRRLAGKNEFILRVLDDAEYRRRVFVSGGVAIDVIWAAANLIGGVCLASIWLVTLGVYYLLLAVMRGTVLHRMRHFGNSGRFNDRCFSEEDHAEEGSFEEEPTNNRRFSSSDIDSKMRSIQNLCGILLLLSAFVLSGIVCLVMLGHGVFAYRGLLIYAVAAFAFYSLTSAIVNYARLRRHSNVLVVLNCRINLAVALVSIFAMEVAMLAEFSTSPTAAINFFAPVLTGAAVAAALVVMGALSIAGAKRHR